MEEDKKLPHHELTGVILNCCFEVMKELGPGFLEKVYKNALLIAMRQMGTEHSTNFYRFYRCIVCIVDCVYIKIHIQTTS
jgi:GxxExxY protein